MKKILIIALCLLLTGCSTNKPSNDDTQDPTPTSEVMLKIPTKEIPDSTLQSESPINVRNIDDYLFREDCIYIDTRQPSEFYTEGSIAGFINIPFYGYIANFNNDNESLFTMTKKTVDDTVIHLGAVGSFEANFEESDELLKEIIPTDKNILVISTAGVESSYFIALLIQLGYDGSMIYNVGSFTNGVGEAIAYRLYEDAKYLVEPIELYDTIITYKFDKLTPIQK